MLSPPTSDEVIDDLGDKVVEALSRSIARTREDLATYRKWRPSWVARHGERGLANWIHDFLWFHLTDLLDGIPGVHCVDKEPTREIMVGTRYRLRAKRHGRDGQVTSYPTQTAFEFKLQGVQDAFPGMEETRLIVGYLWDSETREIGFPVLSLHDGQDAAKWMVNLPEVGAGEGYGGGTVEPLSPVVGPSAPQVDADGITTPAATTSKPSTPIVVLADQDTDRETVTPILLVSEPSVPKFQIPLKDNEAEGSLS